MKYLSCVFMAIVIMACSCQQDTKHTTGMRMENLDTTAVAGDDFYQYACGGWMANNPLTPEYSRFGTFQQLAENNRVQLRSLIEEIATTENAVGTVGQKIADLYNLAMDSIKLNEDGAAPAQAYLEQIATEVNGGNTDKLMATLSTSGVDAYFAFYVSADPMNSDKYMVQTYQSGIGLGQRDYYIDEDSTTLDIRAKYKEHLVNMFKLYGFTAEQAQAKTEAVLAIETRIAKSHYDNVKLRDPHANYNKMTVAELQEAIPQIQWDTYISTLGLTDVKVINLSQREPLIEVGNMLADLPKEDHIAYMQWRLMDASCAYLSDEIYAQNFSFFGKTLSGKEESSPRWKRAVGNVDGVLGEAVGQMYVKKYFPAEAKERMLTLVNNLQVSLGQRISKLEWMGDSTKLKADDKLNNFRVKIGYPDTWRSYEELEIKKDSYFANIVRANQFQSAYMFAKAARETVDKDEWLMTPQTVNAYYNPATNEICFPAGILQYPFFDMNADDAFNYGAIGVVIGHEMTHGFDDQGCQYDTQGNLKNWWTAKDKEQFDARALVLSNYFDSLYVAPGVHANGRFTLGENIADHGGLQVSYQAYKNATATQAEPVVDGFTGDQRFFLSYSNVWAGNIRPEEILVLTKSDPHSLGEWRVNGALPHIQAWYDAFDITEKDALYLAPEKRAVIW